MAPGGAPRRATEGRAAVDGGALRFALRSALRAPQGCARCPAIDPKFMKTKTQKGAVSNEVSKGTFLTRFDISSKSD